MTAGLAGAVHGTTTVTEEMAEEFKHHPTIADASTLGIAAISASNRMLRPYAAGAGMPESSPMVKEEAKGTAKGRAKENEAKHRG